MRFSIVGYPPHANTVLELPDTGPVIVQGVNGSGKSTLLEAYCAALWGRSLRGASAWRGVDYCLTVELPGLTVERTTENLVVNGASALKATKKQPELVSLIGTWDNFTRIRCFDADLTARFGISTDAERKQLLERLCGLDKLNDGLKRCRADIRDATAQQSKHEQQRAVAEAGLKERPTVEAPSVIAMQGLETTLASVETQLREMAKMEGIAAANAAEIDRRLAQLRAERCPLCAAPITPELRSELHAEASRAKSTQADVQAQRKQNETQSKALLRQLQELRAQQAAAIEAEKQATRLAELMTQRDRAAELGAVAERRTKQLRLVEEFLNVARPKLLESLLASLHASASEWLAVMTDALFHLWVDGDNVRVKLGDRDYKELNRGHRRRLDLAIMLALSQLHSAPVRGPIFCDESLDGLDADGAEAAAAVLEAVAQHELVIMLTHSEELAGRLRGVHLHCVSRDGLTTVL